MQPTEFAHEDIFQRLLLCKGDAAVQKLSEATVVVCGIGAVGGFATEMLARCAVGTLVIVDFDVVDVSNINRQIVATTKTIGQPKVQVMAQRIKDINPYCTVVPYHLRLDATTIRTVVEEHHPTILVDAIDSFEQKAQVLQYCLSVGLPVVSSMGAARKTDMARIHLRTLWTTSVCPLARKVRMRLREAGYTDGNVVVVFTDEEPVPHPKDDEGHKKPLPSFAIITTTFGVWAANAAIQFITTGAITINGAQPKKKEIHGDTSSNEPKPKHH